MIQRHQKYHALTGSADIINRHRKERMKKAIVLLKSVCPKEKSRSARWFLLLMIWGFLIIGCSLGCSQAKIRVVNPDQPLAFPADHGAHEDAQWEWWYFNGQLETESGKTYDFFWAFFKIYVDNDKWMAIPMEWMTAPVFFYFPYLTGGFSILDHQENKYHRSYQTVVPFFWRAGFQEGDMNVRIGLNKAWRTLENTFRVQSRVKNYQLDLTLAPERPPLQYGNQQNGTLLLPDTIQKYYSCSRMQVQGTLKKGKNRETVTGISWMDHQYGFIYNKDFKGWDWFCMNLENGVDVVFGVVHYFSGGLVPQSFCAIMFPDGRVEYLEADDFHMQALRIWKSPDTRVSYGIEWEMDVPKFGLKLRSKPVKDKQEMMIFPITFWTGACTVQGTFQGKAVGGRGFLETWGDYQVPFRKFYHSKMATARN